jgi:hypothetical protein
MKNENAFNYFAAITPPKHVVIWGRLASNFEKTPFCLLTPHVCASGRQCIFLPTQAKQLRSSEAQPRRFAAFKQNYKKSEVCSSYMHSRVLRIDQLFSSHALLTFSFPRFHGECRVALWQGGCPSSSALVTKVFVGGLTGQSGKGTSPAHKASILR